MGRQEIKLRRRVRELEVALFPFAKFTREADGSRRSKDEVFLPTEGPAWLYVGHHADGVRVHLDTSDFARVREVLGLGR